MTTPIDAFKDQLAADGVTLSDAAKACLDQLESSIKEPVLDQTDYAHTTDYPTGMPTEERSAPTAAGVQTQPEAGTTAADILAQGSPKPPEG
jgi:hypothetical protein